MRAFSGNILASLVVGLLLVGAVSRADKDVSFKINKLNVIFNKAQHSLGPSKLKDLRSDLKKHEHDELNLKKLKAHNQDKEGLMEASVRKKLLTIMKKYTLERFYEDLLHPSSLNEQANQEKSSRVDAPSFRDSKLDKLWKKAEKAGFDQEQLMILHEEFQHQQNKLDEHYRTSNMVAEELDKNSMNDEKVENSVEGFEPKATNKKAARKKKEEAVEKKARLEANIEQALKEKHNAIKKGYEDLHEKIKAGVVDKERPFAEERVNDLWSIAARSNFTQEELKSFKEELEHYQTRVQKLKHFQNQLDRQKIGVKDYSSNADESDESKHIRKRVNELSHKVHKAHQALVAKIIKDEL